jgi:hypothetical protein
VVFLTLRPRGGIRVRLLRGGNAVLSCYAAVPGGKRMREKFERHRQPWRADELHKLKVLAGKGMALKAIAKALVRSEESVKQRAREDGLRIAKLR